MSGSIPREELTRSIPERFREIVERFPDRPAVEYDATSISYRELAERATRVAALVRDTPAPPGAVVLLVAQGIPLIAAMLGVLEAGDWYVPLDPRLASDRLRDWIVRAGAKRVLCDATTHGIAASVAEGICPVARVDGVLPAAAHGPSPATPDSLAYVYFTSGTTGAPKGVMDSHRNVIHNVLRYGRALQWTHHDRITLLQASHFSGAVSNVFGALLHGALLLPYDVDRDGAGAPLARWIDRVRPTVFHSVPSLFRSICLSSFSFPSVRVVRLEGDAAAVSHVLDFNRHFSPGAQLVHGLGATETGIVSQWFVPHGQVPATPTLPIGTATEDMQVQVLLEGGVAAGPGRIGEIVVRSRHLALGYWRDPERTARAFASDPADPALRSYRTGDLGRFTADGILEHLGRSDRQLKVRGQWVDAAAVESALERMPAVREAAVGLDPRDGDAGLIAYLVARGDPLDATALRRELAHGFPPHAIPGRFHRVEALPLGPNAKLDRAALSPALGVAIAESTGHAPPRDDRERALLAIWKQVLGHPQLGIHDRFLEHGGDSLKAVTVAVEIERTLGITVPHSILAEAPTIAELAARLDTRPAGPRVLIPIRTSGSGAPLFCVHDLESSAFLFATLADHLRDHPVYALTPPVGEPVGTLPRTIGALATRYLQEMRRVAPRGPYALAGFCFGGVVAMEMAHQLRERGEPVSLLALVNITAYDFPRLVTPLALTRFRTRWFARLRYLRDKPDPWRWIGARLTGTAGRVAGRALLPIRTALSGHAAPASATLVRSALVTAFDQHRPGPHHGPVHLFVADDNLPLYADDPHEAWQGIATGPIHIHRFPHDGYAMLTEPDVGRVADILTRAFA